LEGPRRVLLKMDRTEQILRNLESVRGRIRKAAQRAGRSQDDIQLVAVSKKKPLADILVAHSLGQADFAESYAQEYSSKHEQVANLDHRERPTTLNWHFIGPLQRNKAKLVAGTGALLHSVGGEKLLTELEKRTPDGVEQHILIQVNVAQERQKQGVEPAQLSELLDFVTGLEKIRCKGLMLIPPLQAPEASRPHFARLRELRDSEAAKTRNNVDLKELSMGMSGDLDVAIEEGATFVRVGTAIFGARDPVRDT